MIIWKLPTFTFLLSVFLTWITGEADKKKIKVRKDTGEDPSYFTAAFKHGSSHGGCNVNGPKVAKFLDG